MSANRHFDILRLYLTFFWVSSILYGEHSKEAKEYVASKLKVSVSDLADPVVMSEVREDLDIGRVNALPRVSKGIDAKFRIAKLLGIEINCVNKFKDRIK